MMNIIAYCSFKDRLNICISCKQFLQLTDLTSFYTNHIDVSDCKYAKKYFYLLTSVPKRFIFDACCRNEIFKNEYNLFCECVLYKPRVIIISKKLETVSLMINIKHIRFSGEIHTYEYCPRITRKMGTIYIGDLYPSIIAANEQKIFEHVDFICVEGDI